MIQTLSYEFLLFCPEASSREWEVSLCNSFFLPWRPAHSSPACSFEEFFPDVPPQHPLPLFSLFGEHVINISRQEDPSPSRNSLLPCKDRENIRHKNTNQMGAIKRVNINQWLLITYMANCVLKKKSKGFQRGSGDWMCMTPVNTKSVSWLTCHHCCFPSQLLSWGIALCWAAGSHLLCFELSVVVGWEAGACFMKIITRKIKHSIDPLDIKSWIFC